VLTRQEIGMAKRITDYDVLREKIPSLVKDRMGDPEEWLDTGCGMGGSIRRPMEIFGETHFHLAEPNIENMAEAKNCTDSARCTYIASTSDALDLKDSSFDVITAILSHHYYPDRESKLKATSNCFRMLRKGGIFIVVEHRLSADQESADREWRSYMERKGLEEESIREMFNRRNKVYFPMTSDEYLELLRDAGFSEIEQFWDTCSDMGFVARK